MNFALLWRQLADELLVRGDAPALPESPPHVPWIGRIMMAVLGWIAGLMILTSVGGVLFGLLFNDTKVFPGVVGTLLLIAAWFMYRLPKAGEFVHQLAFAFSIAGQLGVGWMLISFERWGQSALTICIMQCILVALMPNRQHRFVSTLFAWSALAAFLGTNRIASPLPAVVALTTVVLWRTETKWICAGMDDLVSPIAHATWFSLLVICSVGLATTLARELGLQVWQASSALAAIWVFAVFMYTEQLDAIRRIVVMIAAVLLAFACWKAPGILACAIALLVAFARGSRFGAALALIAMIAYLSTYYYQTSTTLLSKSFTLAVIALGLWTAAALLYVLTKNTKQGAQS
jgi:Domain of unknown function (DUF4401)